MIDNNIDDLFSMEKTVAEIEQQTVEMNLDGLFHVSFATSVEGLYELAATLKTSSSCIGTETVNVTSSIRIKSSNSGVGMKCGWNGKTLDCSRRNLERLDGLIHIMNVAGLVITDNGNVPIKIIKNIDLTGNKLTMIEDVTAMIKLIPHVKICRLDGNLLETLNADFLGAFNKPTAITLQRNNISELPTDLFSQVKGKLKNLDFDCLHNSKFL